MKFSFRKLASVLTGAVLTLGTTIGMAANYPAPFVQGGSADVAIVYGAAAGTAGTDFTAATVITNDLSTALASQTTTTTVTVGAGEAYNFGEDKDLNMGDVVTSVTETLDESELPTLLAEGTYRNDKSDDFDYDQEIVMAGLTLTHFEEEEDDYTPAIGFEIEDGDSILNYTLDFTEEAESEVDEGDLVDIESTTLKLLGKEFYVLEADNTTLDLTLLDSANTVILNEGETATMTIAGKAYDISAEIYSSTQVVLTVNGEKTNSLENGETEKLEDGTFVGVKEILYTAKETGVSSVDVALGVGELVLYNNADGSNDEVELNDEDVDGVFAYIERGTPNGDKETIDSITLEWKADDDMWLSAEGTSEMVMPGFGAVKLIFGGMNFPMEETIKVTTSSSDKILLDVPLEDAEDGITLNLLQSNDSGGWLRLGKDDNNKLVTSDVDSVTLNLSNGDKWFVASYGSGTTWESYILEVKGVDEKNNKNVTTVEVLNNGNDLFSDDEIGQIEKLGDKINLKIVAAEEDDEVVTISNTSANTHFDRLYTKGGLTVYLPVDQSNIDLSTEPATFELLLQEQDESGNVEAGEYINVTLGFNSDGEAEVASRPKANWAGGSMWETGDGTDKFRGYVQSSAATMVEMDEGGDQDTVDVVYHGTEDDESYADFYVAAPSVSTGAGGGLGTVRFSDAEMSSFQNKNLIVVGGSCINTVAAKMLGSDTPMCGSAFTAATGVGANEALVKVATSPYASNKIAMLVAGYEAADTTKAVNYVVNENPSTAVGEMKLSTVESAATQIQ